MRPSGNFLLGMVGGILLCLLALLALGMSVPAGAPAAGEHAAMIRQAMNSVTSLAEENLRGSAWLFGLVLVCYLAQLSALREELKAVEPAVERVARHEQLVDLCANLFFGIGVIWTAIGMRDALLFALGDPGGAAADGAFAVLQRLVDGGILLALSTTIVGGLGGYVMRAGKSIFLGQRLAKVYMVAMEAPARENLETLKRIEAKLDRRRGDDGGGESGP